MERIHRSQQGRPFYLCSNRQKEWDRSSSLKNNWDIPIFCPPITEHYESGRQEESLIGMFQIICKTSWYVSFFLPIPVRLFISAPKCPLHKTVAANVNVSARSLIGRRVKAQVNVYWSPVFSSNIFRAQCVLGSSWKRTTLLHST